MEFLLAKSSVHMTLLLSTPGPQEGTYIYVSERENVPYSILLSLTEAEKELTLG